MSSSATARSVAVDHIDLEVQAGEFFALLGPSGCGKTTTLRMIGGFEQPTSGLIELKGEDVTWLPPYKRNVNTVFQNYALFPHLTIYENVAFGLRRTKVSDAEIKTRVTDMLQLVELPGYERRKPTQISGGQAQRVALARALINRPSVLLLDEPLGALDLKLRKQMQIELKRIQQEVGITFIFVTHDQEEAMTMSDRIAVMNHGRYEQLGDPASLYERPRDPLRRRVPRRQQPAADDGRRAATATSRSPVSPTGPRSASRLALTEGLDRLRDRRPAREDPAARARRCRSPTASTSCSAPSATRRTSGSRRATSSRRASGGSITVYEQNVQRATRAELWDPGEEVRLVWSPAHTLRGRGRRRTATGPARSRASSRPAPPARPSRRRPQGSRVAGSSSVARSRSWRSGSGRSSPRPRAAAPSRRRRAVRAAAASATPKPSAAASAGASAAAERADHRRP